MRARHWVSWTARIAALGPACFAGCGARGINGRLAGRKARDVTFDGQSRAVPGGSMADSPAEKRGEWPKWPVSMADVGSMADSPKTKETKPMTDHQSVESLTQRLFANADARGVGQEIRQIIEIVDGLRLERDSLSARVAQLEAARVAYASEFPLDEDGEPDVGNIHASIRAAKRAFAQLASDRDSLRDKLRMEIRAHESSCAELVGLREKLEVARAALRWYEAQANGCRKLGTEGDSARTSLDRDGGRRARAALAKIGASE